MRLEVSGKCRLSGAPAGIAAALRAWLTVPNPDYVRLKAMAGRKGRGRMAYGLKEKWEYFRDLPDGSMLAPRGLRQPIIDRAAALGIPCDVIDHTESFPCSPSRFAFSPRPYQAGVVEEMLAAREGILRADTGFGKTAVACALSASSGELTLLVAPRSELCRQALAFWSDHGGELDGRFAAVTWDALRLDPTLAAGRGLVVIDECHGAVSDVRLRTLMRLAPRLLYGMTGTLDRTDGRAAAVGFCLGRVLADRKLPQASPTVRLVFRRDAFPRCAEYHELAESLAECAARNAAVAAEASALAASGRFPLLLTKRVAHAERLAALIHGSSLVRPENASEALDAARSDSRPTCLVSTYSLLATGVDVPALDALLLAGDLRSGVLTRQSAGRVMRLMSGKADPLIVDFADLGHPTLAAQSRRRRQLYAELGWSETQRTP